MGPSKARSLASMWWRGHGRVLMQPITLVELQKPVDTRTVEQYQPNYIGHQSPGTDDSDELGILDFLKKSSEGVRAFIAV